jgi:hypothetical protein
MSIISIITTVKSIFLSQFFCCLAYANDRRMAEAILVTNAQVGVAVVREFPEISTDSVVVPAFTPKILVEVGRAALLGAEDGR